MADVIEISNSSVSDFMNFSTFSEGGFSSDYSYISTELTLSAQRQNVMEGFAVLESPPNGFYKVYPDSDTYVTSENVYYSYSKASIIHSGKLSDRTYMSFMSFYDLINSDIPSNIVDNIISSRLVLKPTMPYTGIIRLYETDRTFDAEYMTWLNHPEAELLIAGQRYNNASTIKIELGKRIKDYIQRKKVHKGFYIEADTGRVEVYSMDMSNPAFVPYIEIEYMDTSLVRQNSAIDTGFNIKPISYIDSSFNLEPIYPSIETELYLTKDSIINKLDFRNANSIDTSLVYKVNSMDGILSELSFSKDVILSDLLLGTQTGIPVDFTFKARVSDKIDSSLSLLHVNPIPSTFDLIYNSIIPTSIQLNPIIVIDTILPLRFENVVDSIETSLEFRKETNITSELDLKPISFLNTSLEFREENNIISELDLKPISFLNTSLEFRKENNITSELDLKPISFLNTSLDLRYKSFLNTSLEFRKETNIISELDLKPISFLNTSLEFRKETNIISELDLKPISFLNTSLELDYINKIDTNLDLVFENSISTNISNIIWKNQESYIDNKLFYCSESIMAKVITDMVLTFKGTSSLMTHMDVVYANGINTTLDLKFNETNTIDTNMILTFIDSNNIITDFNLVMSNGISTSMDLVFTDNIANELDLVFNSNIQSELDLKHHAFLNTSLEFRKENNISSELDLIFNSIITNELDLVFNSNIETVLPLKISNITNAIETSLLYFKDGESSLINTLVLIKNDLTSIQSDLDLVFNSNISTNINLVFTNGINNQLDLVFSSIIESELDLRHYAKIDTDLDLIFSSNIQNQLDLVFNDNINTTLNLIFTNQISSIETSLVYLADNESVIETNFELILKLVNKAKTMIAMTFGKNTKTK